MFLHIIILLLSIVGGFCFWIEIRKWYLNRTKLKSFFKLKEWPIIGIGGRFIGADNEVSMKLIDRLFYESETPFATWLGPSLVIGFDDPEDIQKILNADECLDKPYFYGHLRNETGLLTSKKDVWKKHRRVLNPTFNQKILKNFMPTFNRKAQILVDQMGKKYVSEASISFDIYRIIFKALTDMIMTTALGMRGWELQTKRGDDMHDIFIEVFAHFQSRMVRFWYKWDFIYSFSQACKREMDLLRRGYQILRSVRENKEIELSEKLENAEDELENAKSDNSLTWIQKCFSMYRDGYFTEQNLQEEIDTIFVGGTDTTTVTLSSTLIMLALHRNIQDKVVAELHEVFDEQNSEVTLDDISKLTYLEMVVKESLRHYPVGPFIARETSEDFPFKNGVIPKNSTILINIQKMHKDPKYWGNDADQFNPDHFLPEKLDKMHPYTFLAFSGGPRNCIGIRYAWISMKILLTYLLRQYVFKTHLKSMKDIRTKISIILKIANENPVYVEKRIW